MKGRGMKGWKEGRGIEGGKRDGGREEGWREGVVSRGRWEWWGLMGLRRESSED